MKLTRLQLFNLLHEMNYDNGMGITNFFKYTHDIDYTMTMNKEFILTFNDPKEELVFKLKYSTCIYN